jgi:hypothetical protein
MAYNEFIADRIRRTFKENRTQFIEKKMMGGLCFMVDAKMCCGTHFDKKRGMDLLMARIGEEAYQSAIHKKGCHPMDFTGRPMKGYVFVDPSGIDLDEDLEYWIDLCLSFNPLAKSSKKRSKS